MKKYLYLTIIFLATGLLSGCSLGSTTKIASPEKPAVSNIYKSIDGGKTWEAKNKTQDKVNLASIDVISMAFNVYDSGTLFVGTLKNGILKTEDAGESWSLLNFPAGKVYGLTIDSVDSRIMYASGVWNGRGKIFKSTNAGFEWSEIYTAPSDGPLIISLAMSQKNTSVIFATTSDNQVLKSVDAGVSWKNIYVSQSPVLKIVMDSANDNLVYMNLLDGKILRSIDGGVTNENISVNANGGINTIEVDPSHANWIYAGGQKGLFKSTDTGNAWEELKTLGDSNKFPVKAIAVNRSNSNEIAYGAAQAIYKSFDDGQSWIPFQLDTKSTVSLLKYSPLEENVVYMGLRSN